MTRQQIDRIVAHRALPHNEPVIGVIETFISWVIICEKFTYKIKRPVHFSFLDFSTIERRKNFCLQEYYLNRQLAGDMYVDVLPVTMNHAINIGGEGEVADYAVRMRTMDNNRLMSTMLQKKSVTAPQIDELAAVIAGFHKNARILYGHSVYDLTDKFSDIGQQTDFVSDFISHDLVTRLHRAIDIFHQLTEKFARRLTRRVNLGFFRDCHGDLHSGNIFLVNRPVPFDRIEFDHELREIDVLNEIAFICMDLEYFDEPDLSRRFFETYNMTFPVVLTKEDENLFLLYKAYRSNICAKVNCLKARDAADAQQRSNFLNKTSRYLEIMNVYLDHAQYDDTSNIRKSFSGQQFMELMQ